MQLKMPELSLVVLIGASSAGKTTFARQHFEPTESLSSDAFRAMISDDESNQGVTADAFRLLHEVARTRLKLGRFTVVDATSAQPDARKELISLAREENVHAVAIVLNLPDQELLRRNAERTDRVLPERVILRQAGQVRKSLKFLKREGFRYIYVLNSQEEIESTEIVRERLWNNKKDEHGPFDIIGDVHGCLEELTTLLGQLGYTKNSEGAYQHPAGRKAVFLGDLCDRGPQNVAVLRLAMQMVKAGSALVVPGNHDEKLMRYLAGRQVQVRGGLEDTVAELERESEAFRKEVHQFLEGLISHYVLDDGKLIVAHAGIREDLIGRGSMQVRDFCLYGDTTGEKDDLGLPVRLDWAEHYRGHAMILYGHTPHAQVVSKNNTWNLDTGCVFGGHLTAMRYPEREIVSVKAQKMYCEPPKPLTGETRDATLKITDVQGKRILDTRLMPNLTIPETQTAAALEVVSRFAVDPKWMIYLPPTMSPCETSGMDGYLEYPTEAFAYYRQNGIEQVVCEKKHMGSRCVIVLCKDESVAQKRFGITDGSRGILYTRTGRRFVEDAQVESEILQRLDQVLAQTGFWEDFRTDWVILDTELMPWSEKAQTLITHQYAPVGNAGRQTLSAAVSMLGKTCARQGDMPQEDAQLLSRLIERYEAKAQAMEGYIKAYRAYCWNVEKVDDLRIAPFHLLACEGKVFQQETHVWHMETLRKYVTDKDLLFMATDYRVVHVNEPDSVQEGTQWWLDMTASGGEGMVVKPDVFTAFHDGKLIQPAVKCRGAEYLRIIYGPEYLLPENLERLRKRSLSRKRSLALREFALGMESLDRFVKGDPLYKVHECAFGVLALESEPVDPRL